MFHKELWFTAFAYLLSLQLGLAQSLPGLVFQEVYPQDDNSSKISLYFGLAVSFGGDQTSVGAIPGVKLALDHINKNASILEGYTLKYILTDSQVSSCIHVR